MIEVQPNHYLPGGPEETLVTREVLTCLVFALRIRGKGSGQMGHFYQEPEDDSDIPPLDGCDQMISAAAAAAGDPSLVSGWAAGLSASSIFEPEPIALRQGVADLAVKRGIRLVRSIWLPQAYSISRAELDLRRAKFRVRLSHMDNWKD